MIARPVYPGRPIWHVASLARVLSVSPEELRRLAVTVESYRIPGATTIKPNGERRPTHDAREPLKSIQGRLVKRILRGVQYPDYLLGGLPNDLAHGVRRHYQENARYHAGQAIVINEDVRSFYPSISVELVRRIWAGLFNMSSEVADVLTSLVTYRDEVPQGWSPSSYLANLALWDVEPAVVMALRAQGWRYTRWVDDITLSRATPPRLAEQTAAFDLVFGMLRKKNLTPNRAKHTIARQGRGAQVMGLNVQRAAPTVARDKRAQFRAGVHQLEREAVVLPAEQVRRRRDRLLGEIGTVAALHPQPMAALRGRLEAMATKLGESER